MPEACLDSWQPYGCEWSVGYLWRSMSWPRRLDLIVLALMLAYVVLVFIGVSYRCRAVRRASAIDADGRTPRRLLADLNAQVRNLKSIAYVAPYLGLAGTCIGIFDGLRGVGIVAESALRALILAGVVPIALATAVAGLLVAIPATWSYNSLRTRLDLLECAISGDKSERMSRSFRFAQKFPLAARYSIIPFPLIVAPCLAILAGVVFMEYASYKTPTGLGIELAPPRCQLDGDDRLIVLRVTDGGNIFLNEEREDWNGMARRLSRIYSGRKYRTLYLVAENDVSFQTVADTIDIVESALVDGGTESLDIKVQLITPGAKDAQAPCLEPVVARSLRHVRR